jgi:hypothetical protein
VSHGGHQSQNRRVVHPLTRCNRQVPDR